MDTEYCCECNEETGNAGRDEDSVYILYPDKEVGPLCDHCRTRHYICEKCGEGVYSNMITDRKIHKGCGGVCN